MLQRVGRIVLFALAATIAAGQDPLIGRWRSTDVSASGVSTIFEFRGGDQMDSYSAVVSEEKYRLAGTDTILLQSKERREEKQELEWDSQDRARIEDEAVGKKIELTRLGTASDAKHPLVGEWRTARQWNGRTYPARALFFADGNLLWFTELRAERGSYSVQDRNIRLEVPNHPPVNGMFTVEGDRLTLPNPNGGQSGFQRF